MTRLFSLLMLCLTALPFGLGMGAPAHGDEGHAGIVLERVWARQTGNRTMSAAVYMKITNDGHMMDTLTDVYSDRAAMTQLHRSYEEDGIMRMDHVERLPIAPGETVELSPGGYHVMMMRLTEPLKEGDVFPLTLTFDKAGVVTVLVEVTGMAGPK